MATDAIVFRKGSSSGGRRLAGGEVSEHRVPKLDVNSGTKSEGRHRARACVSVGQWSVKPGGNTPAKKGLVMIFPEQARGVEYSI